MGCPAHRRRASRDESFPAPEMHNAVRSIFSVEPSARSSSTRRRAARESRVGAPPTSKLVATLAPHDRSHVVIERLDLMDEAATASPSPGDAESVENA